MIMHFSIASSGQSLQAPERFWLAISELYISVLEACSQITDTAQHRTGYRVPAAAGEQLEMDERILLTARRNGVPKGAAINISTIRFWPLYFCTLQGQHPHKMHWKKMTLGQRKHKEVRFRVLHFKTTFHIRIGLLSLGKRNPFYGEKLTSHASACGREKKRGLFSSSKHHTKARSCFQQFCWGWVTSSSNNSIQGISDIKMIPHLILLNRKGKPHKTGARQQCSLPIVIWFTNSKLFSPITVSLICHILAPKGTLVL